MEEETKKESGNTTGNTKTYIILGVVVLILVVIGGALLLSGHKTPNSPRQLSNLPTNQNQTQNQPVGAGAGGKQLFKNSPEYQYAYQIFPGTMSAQAKTAMNGFSMKTTSMPDGSTQVSFSSTNPNYKNQSYVVKKGYSLYFIERTTADDNTAQDTDRLYLDDTAVIVDPNGYIAQ